MIPLPELPFNYAALEPVLSAATMKLHHDKHHAKYVETVNALVEGGDRDASLETLLSRAAGPDRAKLLQNAGQAWNHAFFWNCMTSVQTSPGEPLRDAITTAFSDITALRQAFIEAGSSHFGSGWVWLVARGKVVSVMTTHDGGTLAVGPNIPLLVCDLWEHAYYLDHKNDRAGFLGAWWDRLVNWEFSEAQYRAALSDREAWTYEEGSRAPPVVTRDDFEKALEEVTALLAHPPQAGTPEDKRLNVRLEQVSDYHEVRKVEPTPADKERFVHLGERLKAFERRWPKRPPPGTPDHWPPSLGGGFSQRD